MDGRLALPGLGPPDRAEPGFFHAVIDAARTGVTRREDRQLSGKVGRDIRRGKRGWLVRLRVAHDPLTDYDLIAWSHAKLGGDVEGHRPAGDRRRLERTPALGCLVEVIAEFIAVHQPGPGDRTAGGADADDGAAPPDRLHQSLSRDLDDGAPHGLAPRAVRGHQFCLSRDRALGRVVATGYRVAERVSDILPHGHASPSYPHELIHPDVLTSLAGWAHADYIWIECEDAGGPWHIPDNDGRPHGLDVVHALCGVGGWGVGDLDGGRTGRVVWARLELDRSGS